MNFYIVFDWIGDQIKDIVNLHFRDRDEKSEERKEKEKQIKKVMEVFQKALNLAVYLMLVIVLMRFVMIMVLFPDQGMYEIERVRTEYREKNRDLRGDTIRMKTDTIRMKSDSIALLKKEIASLNQAFLSGLKPLNRKESIGVKESSLKAGNKTATVGVETQDLYGIKLTNPVDDFSLWDNFKFSEVNMLRWGAMAVMLLIILWVMKLLLMLFYWIGDQISPFSVIKLVGLCTFVIWLWKSAFHLFDIPVLFELFQKSAGTLPV